MISDNNNNLNLSYHPPNPCLLLLPRSLILSPPPPSLSTFPIRMHPSTFNCHTHRDFLRFYRKACANKKVFSCDLNWDSVGTFLRVAGREFQRDGAMKLKERCPNDLRFSFGILSSFSLEDQREWDGSWVHKCNSRLDRWNSIFWSYSLHFLLALNAVHFVYKLRLQTNHHIW